ncbi:MAG TPA: SDR family NAD(P)-dependent oxidoreductase [Candidatus Micrarchaeia archaeon]|nr:SDR family NAD(P)-dependent oxidoreductase [Candidatus Micrarchaeia archaeon]
MRDGFPGQVVLVTGAGGDLGSAIVDELRDAGAIVVGSDLRDGPPSRPPSGAPAGEWVACDVRSRPQVDALVSEVVGRHGRIDALVVAAGVARWAPALEVSGDVWDEILAVNLTGAFITAQVVAQTMRRGGRPGSIVMIGSWLSESPLRGLSAYSASKAGLEMLARCLALELAPAGIRVNVVAPGVIDAGISARVFAAMPGRREALRAAVPLGALGSPTQVAGCVRMLLSGAADYVTGATLVVDGGIRLAHGPD